MILHLKLLILSEIINNEKKHPFISQNLFKYFVFKIQKQKKENNLYWQQQFKKGYNKSLVYIIRFLNADELVLQNKSKSFTLKNQFNIFHCL